MKNYKIILSICCIVAFHSFSEASLFNPEKRYFIVECDEGDGGKSSYLVPFEGLMVDQARELVQQYRNGDTISKTLSTRIGYAGSNTLNRDYLNAGSRWGWEVVELIGIFDGAYSVGGKSPPPRDQDIAEYIEGTYGLIQPTANLVGELPINPDLIISSTERTSLWFGRYDDNYYPWINHQDLGWLYILGFDPNSIWMYSPSMSWVWTSETYYPWVWLNKKQCWAYHNKEWIFLREQRTEPIKFTVYETGEIVTYP
jgi:hypothetical protein